MNVAVLTRKLKELENFHSHWHAELIKELGIAVPPNSIGVSFEPTVKLGALVECEPVALGFYCCKSNSQIMVEVVGQDVASDLVILDSAGEEKGVIHTETMSHRLFLHLFEPLVLPNT